MKTTDIEKVIAFQRVSTDSQEIEEQAKQLKDYILRDGYSEENIITIEGFGASAIKEDEDYKMCIQQIYESMEQYNIKCIYCWELSRIFRNVKTGTNLVEYLKENKIDLKIMNPSLYLLDPTNKEINTGMELAISLFTTMAAQEMRIKKARFKRAKDKNSREGKWNGGRTIPYGYKVDENNYFIVDEGESKVVLEVFQRYATGKYSIATLTKEMRELGYDFITPHWINNKLHSTIYIGYSRITNKDGKVISNRVYPPIISEELYNKVQEKLQANFNGDILKQKKHHHYCSKLIKCSKCGKYYVAVKNEYKCNGLTEYDDKKCDNSLGVSISKMDGLAWDIASWMEENRLLDLDKKQKTQLQKEIAELEKKIKNVPNMLQTIKDKREKATIRNIEGTLSDGNFEKLIDKYNMEYNELEGKLIQYNNQIEFNKSKIEDLGKEIDEMDKFPQTIEVVVNYTEEEKQKTIRKYIKEIKLYPESKTTIIIDVLTVYGYLTLKYHPWNKRNTFENLSGSMMIIEPIYRDREGEALTLKDYVSMAADGKELTPAEKQRIKNRDKWLDDMKKKMGGLKALQTILQGKVELFHTIHNNPYNPTL